MICTNCGEKCRATMSFDGFEKHKLCLECFVRIGEQFGKYLNLEKKLAKRRKQKLN